MNQLVAAVCFLALSSFATGASAAMIAVVPSPRPPEITEPGPPATPNPDKDEEEDDDSGELADEEEVVDSEESNDGNDESS